MYNHVNSNNNANNKVEKIVKYILSYKFLTLSLS